MINSVLRICSKMNTSMKQVDNTGRISQLNVEQYTNVSI